MASDKKIPELVKLLQLTPKMLRSGVARSQHDSTEGIWQSAIGLNPFLEDDAARFLCATTASPTRIGSADFTDIPIAYAIVFYSTNAAMAVLGASGRFYLVFSDGTYVVVRPQSILTALTNPTGGMVPVTDSGGNSYLFFACRQDLGRWNLNTADSAAHWNINNNGLANTNHHPMKRVFDQVYFGNGRYLGTIPLTSLHNQATTFTNINFQLIDFGADQTVTAIGDDGRYALVAMSRQFDETTSAETEARIVWYPNVGINWDWEVTLKGERAVRSIIRNSLGTFAICERNTYQLAFGAQPKLVRNFSTSDSPGGAFNAISQGVGPRVNIAAPFGDAMVFGKRGAMFGKRFPTEGVTFSHPLQGHTSDISMVAPDFVKDKIFVGTEDSKFWSYDLTAAGASSNSYVTHWLDLGQRCSLGKLQVEMPAGIGASDTLGIKVEVPSGEYTTVTLSQALIAAKRRNDPMLLLKGNLQGSQVRLTFTPSAGTPKFSTLTLYGRPTAE